MSKMYFMVDYEYFSTFTSQWFHLCPEHAEAVREAMKE